MRTKKYPSGRFAATFIVTPVLVFVFAGCAPETGPTSEPSDGQNPISESTPPATEAAVEEQPEVATQEETCGWDSPKLAATVEIPEGQSGALPEVLVGAWQHTHTDDGSGFEEVTNDHRYVFPAPERMLYCQHVPGATDHAENAANVVLNDTAIELPGGKYAYTVTAWDQDTMIWDNPVGGGYIYLLQRR